MHHVLQLVVYRVWGILMVYVLCSSHQLCRQFIVWNVCIRIFLLGIHRYLGELCLLLLLLLCLCTGCINFMLSLRGDYLGWLTGHDTVFRRGFTSAGDSRSSFIDFEALVESAAGLLIASALFLIYLIQWGVLGELAHTISFSVGTELELLLVINSAIIGLLLILAASMHSVISSGQELFVAAAFCLGAWVDRWILLLLVLLFCRMMWLVHALFGLHRLRSGSRLGRLLRFVVQLWKVKQRNMDLGRWHWTFSLHELVCLIAMACSFCGLSTTTIRSFIDTAFDRCWIVVLLSDLVKASIYTSGTSAVVIAGYPVLLLVAVTHMTQVVLGVISATFASFDRSRWKTVRIDGAML